MTNNSNVSLSKKERIKLCIYTLLSLSGFYRIWCKFNRNNVVVLMLHGVMDDDEPSEWLPTRPQVSRVQLEETIKLISKYGEFISLKEAVEMMTGQRPFRDNCVALSFDDGYRNNLTHAWPILKRYNVPAIIFPSAGHVEHREPLWYDRFDYAIQHAAKKGCSECQIGEQTIAIKSANRLELQASVQRAIMASKAIPGNDFDAMNTINKAIIYLEEKGQHRLSDIFESDCWTGIMTWDELRQARDEGIDIGSHTISHARLALLSDHEVRDELIGSKQMIEQELSRPCDYLCYPDGSYNERAITIAQECGYKAALTTNEGINKAGDCVMRICRFHLPQGHYANAAKAVAVTSGFIYKNNRLKKWLLG